MVSNNVRSMLTLIMQETFTDAGLRQDFFTLSQVPMSWRSTLQSTVVLSTTKAEYMAMTEAKKEDIWLQKLLDDLGIDQDQLKINCDNMSTIYLAKNQVYYARRSISTSDFTLLGRFSRKVIWCLRRFTQRKNLADMLIKVVL